MQEATLILVVPDAEPVEVRDDVERPSRIHLVEVAGDRSGEPRSTSRQAPRCAPRASSGARSSRRRVLRGRAPPPWNRFRLRARGSAGSITGELRTASTCGSARAGSKSAHRLRQSAHSYCSGRSRRPSPRRPSCTDHRYAADVTDEGRRTDSGIELEPIYRASEATIDRARSARPASSRSHAASTRTCIGGGSGRCVSTPGWARPPRRTVASGTCSITGRRGCPWRSTSRRRWGWISDHPRAEGEVGRTGVAIDSIEDMARLFEDIPLNRVSTSMTINATAPMPPLALRAGGRGARIDPSVLAGTVQNDLLKEYAARGTYIYPPAASMRLITDVFSYATGRLPRWNTISIGPATTCGRPARPPRRRSASRSPTGSRTCGRPSTPASRSTTWHRGCRSSSRVTCTSSKRSRSSGPRGGCGPRSCAIGSGATDPRSRALGSTPRPAARP